MRFKFFALFVIILFIAACAGKGMLAPSVELSEDFVLPFSDKTVTGSLENGFKYYIRYNDFPADKIELQLNVRSGSLNETEEERGIAHFVEHMAFNGTKNYKSNDLIKFMEAAGLVFGKDSNAFTAYKNTRYLLTIPSDNATLLEDAFGIMRDWVDGVSFDPKEIEKEKGVIIEEWRSRNDAANRVRRKSAEYIYAGSLYPLREPIGLTEVVSGADRDLVKGYYDKWYAASNSALVIVGNVDTVKAEDMVKRYFGELKKKDTPKRADDTVPLSNGTVLGIISDPEITSASFSITFFEEEGRISRYKELKKSFLESGALNMLNKRVGAAILEKRTDLLSFRSGKANMDNNLSMLRFIVMTKPENLENDIRTALIEAEKAKRFGFSETELKEFITNQKTFLERAASPDYKYQSSKYAESLADYDTSGGYFTEFTQDKALLDRIFSETELADYNRAFSNLLKSKSVLVLVTVPERDKSRIILKAEDFVNILGEIAAMALEPDVQEISVDKLIDNIPQGGDILSRKRYENVDGELITYANGVRLFVKKNAADKGHFTFEARKPGGLSALKDDEVVDMDILPQVIASSGFDNITGRQLQMFMAGKRVNAAPSVSEYSFEFGGGGDSVDIETLFQLLYKNFTAPNVDKNAFASIIKRLETSLINTEKDKKTLFFRDAVKAMNNSKYRRNYLLSGDLAAITPELLLKLYKANFGDAGNFVFVLAGDLDIESAAEYGRIYLGGLAAPEKKSAA
ncbi:MAG: insulinase family protein, partial [Deferribacteraceae bacterium]|nr:insulinase family protein [Deferribacteraceae bacterium]